MSIVHSRPNWNGHKKPAPFSATGVRRHPVLVVDGLQRLDPCRATEGIAVDHGDGLALGEDPVRVADHIAVAIPPHIQHPANIDNR